MVFEGLVGLGIALLFGTALAEYSKFRQKSTRGWNWLALAGAWFIFAGSFGVATALAPYVTATLWEGISLLFQTLGWLFALIGAIFVAYETLVEK